jgi:drug/metabolite transporter (DMT)-like permease
MGIILAFASSLATASRVYVFGRQVKETHPAVVGSRIFILTSILSLLLLFYKPILLPNSTYGYIGAIASSTALMFASFGTFYGISLLGTFRYSLLVKLEPVFTAIFSYLILKETLLPIQYLGMAIVIISLVSYQIFEERKPIET